MAYSLSLFLRMTMYVNVCWFLLLSSSLFFSSFVVAFFIVVLQKGNSHKLTFARSHSLAHIRINRILYKQLEYKYALKYANYVKHFLRSFFPGFFSLSVVLVVPIIVSVVFLSLGWKDI